MLRTITLLIVALALAASTGCIVGDDVSEEERDRAIQAAMEVYEEVADSGRDLSNGPCIADELDDVPGWSVDIAHDPREDVDNDPANQCQAYRDGQTSHFVELTPEGELIRAK